MSALRLGLCGVLLAMVSSGSSRAPVLGETVHFVNYVPPLVGQEQAAVLTRIHHEPEWEGSASLVYFTGNPSDPENPPPFLEFKHRRWRDQSGTPNTWHYPAECPNP